LQRRLQAHLDRINPTIATVFERPKPT